MRGVRITTGRLGHAAPAAADGETLWREVRRQRNALLDAWRWTVLPDSPLSAECQAAFGAYLAELHRVTVDHSDPAAIDWPVPPPLVYA